MPQRVHVRQTAEFVSTTIPPFSLPPKFSDRKHASCDRKSTAPSPYPISTFHPPDSARPMNGRVQMYFMSP